MSSHDIVTPYMPYFLRKIVRAISRKQLQRPPAAVAVAHAVPDLGEVYIHMTPALIVDDQTAFNDQTLMRTHVVVQCFQPQRVALNGYADQMDDPRLAPCYRPIYGIWTTSLEDMPENFPDILLTRSVLLLQDFSASDAFEPRAAGCYGNTSGHASLSNTTFDASDGDYTSLETFLAHTPDADIFRRHLYATILPHHLLGGFQ